MTTQAILPTILATLSGVPRYIPDVEWSDESVSFNIFRLYEQIFGRRNGIKREVSWVGDRVRRWTFEAKLMHVEHCIRTFRLPRFHFEYVPAPQLAFNNGLSIPLLNFGHYRFAVARDGNNIGAVASQGSALSFNITSAGSNRYLVAIVQLENSVTPSAFTYDSVSIIGGFVRSNIPDSRGIWGYAKANPNSGTKSLALTASGSGWLTMSGGIYSGAQQTDAPDNSGDFFSGTSSNDVTVTLTPVAANCWIVGHCRLDNGGTRSGTGAFNILSENATWGMAILDSNGTTSGATAVGMHSTSSGGRWELIMSVAPFVASNNYTSTLTETITNTPSFIKTTTKVLTQAITNTDSIIRTTTRTLSETIANTATVLGQIVHASTLSETIANADTFVRSLARTLSESLTNTDTLLKTSARTLVEAITNSDTFTKLRAASAVLTEGIANADVVAVAKILSRTYNETVTNTASLIRTVGRAIMESVATSDTFSRVLTATRTFSETVTLTPLFKALRNGYDVFWNNVSKSTASLSNVVKSAATWINKDRT